MVDVLAPRAGAAGAIASLLRLGVQIVDVVSGAGAITQYTVGPAWTGAQFTSVNAALAAADASGNSNALGGVVIFIYPAFYNEAVVVPATLFNWHLVGLGQGQNTGPYLSSLTVAMAPTGTPFCSISGLRVIGATNMTRAAGGGNGQLYLNNLRFQGAVTADLPAIDFEAFNCWASSDVTVSADVVTIQAAREFLGALNVTTIGDSRITAQRLAGAVTLQSVGGFSRLVGCPRIAGVVTFNGSSGVLQQCTVVHAGSPAVVDNTTLSSFCSNNSFVHDAGPLGAVWVKNGGGVFHEGGNVFTEGQLYPWYQLTAGTRADVAESDVQVRRVFQVTGSPVLTSAQVGGQRKTTVAKADGGGVVTLPVVSAAVPTNLAAVEPDTTLIVKDLNGNAAGANVTVVGSGGQLIDGAANYVMAVNFEAIELQALAAGWAIVGRYP